LVECRIPAKGISHSIQQPLLEESLRRNAISAKGAVRPPGQSTGVYTTLPGQNAVKHCTVTIGWTPDTSEWHKPFDPATAGGRKPV